MKIIKSRLFKILIVLFIFGFCLGIISSFISKDNSSIIVNTNNNEQSFYCNDINEKKEGEDIHKIYYIAMHNN